MVAIAVQISAKMIEHHLIFNVNQIELNEAQKKEIRKLPHQIKDYNRVMIFPLTFDSIFERFVFTKLAPKQAQSIAEYAKSIGFEIIGKPSNFPSAFRGRSIAVTVKYTRSKLPDIEERPLSLETFFPEKPSQFFVIDPNKDTLVVGNEGTELLFRKGCLMSKTPVQIELKEYYDFGDYMKAGLPTVSNGKLIQTGGTIYLNASPLNQPKEKVKINPQKGIKAGFTKQNINPDMQIFIQDPRSKAFNWIVQPQPRADWKMTETLIDYDGKVLSEKVYNSKEEWENAKREEAESNINRLKNGSGLEIFNIGMINCDAFYDAPLEDYQLIAKLEQKADYYLVFAGVGVMKGYHFNNSIQFDGVPLNKESKLIVVAFEDEQPLFYEETLPKGRKPQPTIDMQPVDKIWLNTILSGL